MSQLSLYFTDNSINILLRSCSLCLKSEIVCYTFTARYREHVYNIQLLDLKFIFLCTIVCF
jgi:hypothetical protein